MKKKIQQLVAQARARGVLKVAAGYVAFGWLTLSVGNTLFNLFELPSAGPKIIFLLFALGLPVAVLGAWKGWFGEARVAKSAATGNGNTKGATGDSVEPLVKVAQGAWPALVFTIGTVLAVAIATGLTVYGLTNSGKTQDATSSAQPGSSGHSAAPPVAFAPPAHSIAVLPFVNMSGDAEQQYFSDGLCEELLNSLARISELRVAARTSSFSFKGKEVNIADVGRALNVGTVLEGSVRKAGTRVRITAQLINAVTGFHLWSQTYDRDLRDILAVQTEIATAVASKLEATLLGSTSAVIELGGTNNPDAFDVYLRAQYMNAQPRPKEALLAQLAVYDKAIALDPQFAKAYIGRADTLGNLGALMSGDSYSLARTAAEKAIELAPQLGAAHAGLADILDGGFADYPAARREYQRALELSPGDAYVLSASAQFFSAHGDPALALGYGRRAVALDPLNTQVHRALGFVFYTMRKFPEAIASFDDALKFSPSSPQVAAYRGFAQLMVGNPQAALKSCEVPPRDLFADFCVAMAYGKLHRQADADKQLAMLMKQAGEDFAYQYAQLYAQWGDAPKALHWLDAAYRVRDPGLMELNSDPLLDPLRSEPRFKAIERKLKTPA